MTDRSILRRAILTLLQKTITLAISGIFRVPAAFFFIVDFLVFSPTVLFLVFWTPRYVVERLIDAATPLLGSRRIGAVFASSGDHLDHCWLVGIGTCSTSTVVGEVPSLLIS